MPRFFALGREFEFVFYLTSTDSLFKAPIWESGTTRTPQKMPQHPEMCQAFSFRRII